MNNEVMLETFIHTRLLRRGKGLTEDDPMRIIDQYWNFKGDLVFEYDPYTMQVGTQFFRTEK